MVTFGMVTLLTSSIVGVIKLVTPVSSCNVGVCTTVCSALIPPPWSPHPPTDYTPVLVAVSVSWKPDTVVEVKLR